MGTSQGLLILFSVVFEALQAGSSASWQPS